jgi:hypothetical protein
MDDGTWQGAGSSRQGAGPLAVLSGIVTCWLDSRYAGKTDNTARRRRTTPWTRCPVLAVIVLPSLPDRHAQREGGNKRGAGGTRERKTA